MNITNYSGIMPIPIVTPEMAIAKGKKVASLMREKLTTDEQMKVAFVPLIIQHIIFDYAGNFTKCAADNKVDAYKKHSRAIRQLHTDILNDMRRDLDGRHMAKIVTESDRFIQACARDMLILYFSVNGEVKKRYPRTNAELYTYAFITLELIKYMESYVWRMNDFLAEKIGTRDDAVLNPFVADLRKVMRLVVGDMAIDVSGHVATCVKIFDKQIKSIGFEDFRL